MARKNGFTLIEVLVASLLMSMLVVILTMVFNQSSIAWRTGKANVSELDQIRRRIAVVQRQADNLLPGINPMNHSQHGFVASPWKNSQWSGGKNSLRRRAVEVVNDTKLTLGSLDQLKDAWQEPNLNLGNIKLGELKPYVVGVKSWGPDGQQDTEDDISSWPVLEVE